MLSDQYVLSLYIKYLVYLLVEVCKNYVTDKLLPSRTARLLGLLHAIFTITRVQIDVHNDQIALY